jgi:hypothetical protein
LHQALMGADVLICSIDPSDLGNNVDFAETRLSGLIKHYAKKQVIFVTQITSEVEKTLTNLKE